MDYRKIIIVGENNIGRSFMAECILRGILQKRNCQNKEVVSRGLVVLFSEPVAPGAAKILREKGNRIEDFRSSQLTSGILSSVSVVSINVPIDIQLVASSNDSFISSASPFVIANTKSADARSSSVSWEERKSSIL